MKSQEPGDNSKSNKKLSLENDTRLDSDTRAQMNWEKLQDAFENFENSKVRFENSRGSTEEDFARFTTRKDLIKLNQIAGLASSMVETHDRVMSIGISNGLALAENKDAVALVAADMKRQEQVKEMKALLYDGKNEDADMSYVEMASGIPYGSMSEKKGEWLASRVDEVKRTILKPGKAVQTESSSVDVDLTDIEAKALKDKQNTVTVNTFTDAEQARRKAEWLQDNPGAEENKTIHFEAKKALHERGLDLNLDIPSKNTQDKEKGFAYDGDKMVEDAKKAVAAQIEETLARFKKEDEEKKKKSEWEINGPVENWGEDPGFVRPVNGEVEPIKELVSDLSKQETATQVVGKTETVEKKKRMTEEEYKAQVEIWKKNLEGARVAVENAEKALEESKEKSKKNLESMGLNRIEKGLAAWKKVHPGYKMALGLTLGASGLGAVAVGLSAVTFTEKVYREKQAALEASGKTENKYWTIGKSAGIGVLLALGSSLAGQYVSGVLSEGSPSMLDSVRGFFSPAAGIPPVETEAIVGQSISPSAAIISGYDLPPTVTESVVPSPVADTALTESPVSLAEEVSTSSPIAPEVQQAPSIVLSDNYTYAEPLSPEASASLHQIPTDFSLPISLNETYVMQLGDTTDSILQRVLNTVPELHALPELDKLSYIENLKEQWSTTMSSASTPNWSLKEMMGGGEGSKVHHLDHVRDAFVTLGERSNIITTFKN